MAEILLNKRKSESALPFAGLARAGFVATQMLRSLVELGVLSEARQGEFMASLDTVARQLGCDLARLARGELEKKDFLARYGHLRPGTYDIESRRYDEDFDRYFASTGEADAPAAHPRLDHVRGDQLED